jgi:tRNA G26 N,N-dimethylase Trm1
LRANHRRIDVIDIDPFGSPMHAVPAALACIHSGGILSIAFFDLNVLCGSMRSSDSAAVCFATYAATPLNMRPAHEVAVRMALGTCCRIAASLGRSIHPLLCANMQSCIRLILRVTNIDAPLTLSLPAPQSLPASPPSSGGLPPSSASFRDRDSSPVRDCKSSGAPPPSFASVRDAAWLHSGTSDLALSYILKCAVCCGWALQKVGCATTSARTSACEVCGGVGTAVLGGPIYDAALADSEFLQECARQVA